MLVAQIPPLIEDQYMGFFLGGLKEELKWEVAALEPISRYKMISLALPMEKKKAQPNRRH